MSTYGSIAERRDLAGDLTIIRPSPPVIFALNSRRIGDPAGDQELQKDPRFGGAKRARGGELE